MIIRDLYSICQTRTPETLLGLPTYEMKRTQVELTSHMSINATGRYSDISAGLLILTLTTWHSAEFANLDLLSRSSRQ